MQAELELVAEQRAQALAIANAFDQRERDAHAVGREVDRKLARSLRRRTARRQIPRASTAAASACGIDGAWMKPPFSASAIKGAVPGNCAARSAGSWTGTSWSV